MGKFLLSAVCLPARACAAAFSLRLFFALSLLGTDTAHTGTGTYCSLSPQYWPAGVYSCAGVILAAAAAAAAVHVRACAVPLSLFIIFFSLSEPRASHAAHRNRSMISSSLLQSRMSMMPILSVFITFAWAFRCSSLCLLPRHGHKKGTRCFVLLIPHIPPVTCAHRIRLARSCPAHTAPPPQPSRTLSGW